MSASKIIKTISFVLVYWINLVLAAALWLCGQSGNIMLGILLIVLYRLSLWSTPFLVTLICWLPSMPKLSVKRKLLINAAHLLLCGALYVLCFLLFGNWF